MPASLAPCGTPPYDEATTPTRDAPPCQRTRTYLDMPRVIRIRGAAICVGHSASGVPPVFTEPVARSAQPAANNPADSANREFGWPMLDEPMRGDATAPRQTTMV